VKFSWVEPVCIEDGKMKLVHCNVCSQIEGREIFFMPRLDFSMKHFGLSKCTKAKRGVVIGQFFSCPTNQHVKNEKLFTFVGYDIIIVQVANQGKVEKKRKYVQFVAILHLL